LARKLTPVTLPPGLLRLATRPSLTGSAPVTTTIGTAAVAALVASAAPVGMPWMWTLALEHHGGRTPNHGYAATREAAMAAFAKSWRRGVRHF